MNKAEFMKVAPLYYELAIVLRLQLTDGYISERELRGAYFIVESSNGRNGNSINLLADEELLQVSLSRLVDNGVIEALLDPFGPSQFGEGPELSSYVDKARSDRTSPHYKADASGNQLQWLQSALLRLNHVGRELGIAAEDWRSPESDWQPIPLDRTNELLGSTIEAIDHTITAVEQSNGYASGHPEERKYVLDNLRLLAGTLKTAATTSVNYVRTHGLDVLQKLQDRFGTALIGEAARETAKAIWQWLREATKALF